MRVRDPVSLVMILMTLLGVVQAARYKGFDHADGILNLLEYYDNVDQIVGIFCQLHLILESCHLSGAFVILSNIFNIHFIWFLCRRHMLEVHIQYLNTWKH